MKVTKEFQGVPDGEVYPRTYQPGDDCPAELLEAAVALEAVEPDAADPEPVAETPPAQPAAQPKEKADKPAENKARTKRETK
jgi:hypothetical protein